MDSIKFYDTNALLLLKEKAFGEKFVISSITLEELENIKTSRNKDDKIKFDARTVTKLLDEKYNMYEVVIYDTNVAKFMPQYVEDSFDARIITCAKYYHENYLNGDMMTFVTDDILCKLIAQDIFKLKVESIKSKENIYKGYKIISGNSLEINDLMKNIQLDDWFVNEYLIIHNTEDNTDKEMRFDGERFVPLKLPSSKFIKAKNSLQRCALDILNNPDITIAAILGGFGSGKTFISMQMALYHVTDKGSHSKILGVRSPQGDGVDIGYLPGTAQDKTQNFFLPLAQQLSGGEFELEGLKQRGLLESNIPYYMKGTTYNNTIIIVDEAEDLDEKQIRLVGTRVGQNSKIYFSGDYRQSVINATKDNALVKMCNELKGNKCFATIYLGEDVRSETSKMFASLFE